jgi:uncharacterized repeat protein (TIGR03809 family)
MTHRIDVAEGRDHGLDLGARWRDLAERRLEYLTELFESGRWRRYYSERAFLENIQEAKAAVALWRNLSMPQAIETTQSNGEVVAQAAPIIVQTTAVVDMVGADSDAASEAMPPPPVPVPPLPNEETAQSKATEARYALLRNML